MKIKSNPGMELRDAEGLENRMGYWMKKRSLDEKIKDSDLDNDLKKEIIEKSEEKKMKPIHDSYIDRRGFVHCIEKDGETGEVVSDDVESEPDPDELNERMREEGR